MYFNDLTPKAIRTPLRTEVDERQVAYDDGPPTSMETSGDHLTQAYDARVPDRYGRGILVKTPETATLKGSVRVV